MNKKVKFAFLKALRSGQFNKGNMSLRDSKNRYTALGVLCKITGNSKNRNMRGRYPRVDDKANVLPFSGLTAAQQRMIAKLDELTSDFNDVIRYVSRNIKTAD